MTPKSAQIPAPQQKIADTASPTVSIDTSTISKPRTPTVSEEELTAETDNLVLTFSNLGGAIKGIVLKSFKESNSDSNLQLINLTDPTEYILSISSTTDPKIDCAEYEGERVGDSIIYKCNIDDLFITKKYTLYKSKYGISLDIDIKNMSDSQKSFSYRIVGGAGLTEKRKEDQRSLEVSSSINGKLVGHKKPKAGQRIINPGVVGWSALKNKYFSLIIKPAMVSRSQFYNENTDGLLVMGVDAEPINIHPNSTISNKFTLYAGPSSIQTLKELNMGLEETMNYGFFGGISKVMISVMGLFYTITRSWGVSIILLAVALNLLLFPLTVKSFKSMKKMQELHPQMELLKKQYKDSPDKLNKAMMELYKKYQINPLSGCLPILLQMPIFIALYSALMKAIELRNTSFLWIKDLSAPDAVPLPFALPLIGNSINILPLVMVVAMVVQQKISTSTMGSAVTAEQKEQQKIMLIMMPIMFGFIFYGMPSGLVLYWVVNTVLTITEQASLAKSS